QELTVVGINATLLPSDSAAAGNAAIGVAAADAQAWGDTAGFTAAIVVAKNLPINDGAWSWARAHVAGIEPNPTGAINHQAIADYIAVFGFPTGKLNDTTPNKVSEVRAYAPFVNRITQGETLDIALVVRAAQANNASGVTKYL